MRKGMWSAAAFVTLVTGAVVFGGPSLQAADNRVAFGSSDEPLKFLPAEISVPVGTKVEWFNETDLQHDVTADDGSFDSKGLLGKGQKYEFTFTKAGDFKYFCNPHKDAGMKGVVKVTPAGTPTTAATTPTTQPGTATTVTTVAGQGTTTTTAKAAAGASSTTATTAAAAGNGSTTTTAAPAGASSAVGETTTTTAAGHAEGGGGEDAAADHGAEGDHKTEKKKNSPIGIAFASLSTVLLVAIAGKLLASKS